MAALALASCSENANPSAAGTGEFTIVVLPDTQVYSSFFHNLAGAQTDWIAQNHRELNVAMVLHVGDLVEASWRDTQWGPMSRAFETLDEAEVPYAIAPGNHDYGVVRDSRNARDRSTKLHEYFPDTRLSERGLLSRWPEGRVDNSAYLYQAQEDWLFLSLEFAPRPAALQWAKGILDRYPEANVVISTHLYLYADNTRYDVDSYGEEQVAGASIYGVWSDPEGATDGQDIYEALLADRNTPRFVLCGHDIVDGLARRSEGNLHEMLANYQIENDGGGSTLRLLRVNENARTVQVETYSPHYNEYRHDEENEFVLSY